MSEEKCFCHFNGYKVKDAEAQARLKVIEDKFKEGYLKPSGTLTITSNGTKNVADKAYVSVAVPTYESWVDFAKSVINGTVTEINANYFTGIEHIREYAFAGCKNLTSVEIGSRVIDIHTSAFQDCTNLTSVIVSDSVQHFGKNSFNNCTSLKSIRIPQNVEYINNSAFKGCTALNTVTMLKGIMYIYGYAFADCTAITNIDLPNSLVDIAGYAFSNTGIINLTIPSSVKYVRGCSFANCNNLESVTFKGKPEEIVASGFPVFNSCPKLTNIYVPWSEGEVAGENVKWGASRATIHYNYNS